MAVEAGLSVYVVGGQGVRLFVVVVSCGVLDVFLLGGFLSRHVCDLLPNLLLQTHLNQTIIALNPTSMFQSLILPNRCRPLRGWKTRPEKERRGRPNRHHSIPAPRERGLIQIYLRL